jgi:nitric oxide reductase large subunit
MQPSKGFMTHRLRTTVSTGVFWWLLSVSVGLFCFVLFWRGEVTALTRGFATHLDLKFS